jgi:hypothetical protein
MIPLRVFGAMEGEFMGVNSNRGASQTAGRKGYKKPTLVKGPALSSVTGANVSKTQ